MNIIGNIDMISSKNNQINSIFERIVKDKNGVLVRVLFTIVEVEGVLRGQVVSIEPLVKEESSSEAVYLSPVTTKKTADFTYTPLFNPIVSPFNSLFFFNSQPTRAPAFAI